MADYVSDLLQTTPATSDGVPPPEYKSDLLTAQPATQTAAEDQSIPSWGEIPGRAASHLAPSAMKFGENIAQTVMHPIETAENIKNLGHGILDKLGVTGSHEHEKYADAVGNALVERYGSIDNLKRTMANDPVGFLADASTVLTGGGSMIGALPGTVGKIGEVASAVGRVADPLNVLTKPVGATGRFVGDKLAEIAGVRTGAGAEAFKKAAEAGYTGGEAAQSFQENIRGHAPVEDIVRTGMKSVENIIREKNTNYRQGIAQAGLNAPMVADDFRAIAKGMADADQVGHLRGFVTQPDAIRASEDLRGIVDHFVYGRPDLHTIEGMDALKQAIGAYQKELTGGTPASAVASMYYDAVLNAVKNRAPKYAEIMENYGEAKNLLSQIQKSLSLPANERKLNIDTALRKLQSVMRNNVNTSYGFRKTLLEELEAHGAPNLSYSIAGQALGSKSPRGLARIGFESGAEMATALMGLFTANPALMWPAVKAMVATAITTSPRALGETAYYAGRAASVAKPLSYVGKPAIRAAQQAGKLEQPYTGPNLGPLQPNQARGGAVDRALRMSRRK